MIAKVKEARELTRGRVRQAVLALLVLGVLYGLSGGRPLLLILIVGAIAFAYTRINAEQDPQTPTAPDATAAPDTALDYEQTLEVLLGMVDREVIALIALQTGTPPGLAHLQGTLVSAIPDSGRYRLIDDSYREQEVLFIAIDTGGFWLPRRDFVSARHVEAEGQVGIELVVGDLRVGIYDDQASRLSEIPLEDSA